MEDSFKTRQELINEISLLRQRVEELERSEGERKKMEEVLRASQVQSSDATGIALSHARVLSGSLRICSSCKRIRNDEGGWEQMEEYIRNHSGVDFSHTYCPECAEKLRSQLHQKE
ncbi:MAG: hypothetical protein GXX82_14500 [Syntrophorhabdus sp.]|nr:hypothetical protein [Syntrophorhabdus sp.]